MRVQAAPPTYPPKHDCLAKERCTGNPSTSRSQSADRRLYQESGVSGRPRKVVVPYTIQELKHYGQYQSPTNSPECRLMQVDLENEKSQGYSSRQGRSAFMGGEDKDADAVAIANQGSAKGTSSRSPSPHRRAIKHDEDAEDEDMDESFSERLCGLLEMFPEPIRDATHSVIVNTVEGVKALYSCSRSVAWIFFSSSAILFAPLIFEVERANMDEMQKHQQRQILLGPNAAVSGGMLPMQHR